MINLEGPSPIGLCSLVANYFHSEKDTTCRALTNYILRATLFTGLPVLIPLAGPLLCFIDSRSFFRCLYISFCIRAFCFSFLPMKSFGKKPCSECRFVQPAGAHLHEGLLQETTAHLEAQTLLLAKIRNRFIKSLHKYLELLSLIWSSFEESFSTMFRYFLGIVFVLTISLVNTILIIQSLVKFAFSFLLRPLRPPYCM